MNLSEGVAIGVFLIEDDLQNRRTETLKTRIRNPHRRLFPDVAYALPCVGQVALIHPASLAKEDAPEEPQACECCQTPASPEISSSLVENFVSPYSASTQMLRNWRDASATTEPCQ